MSKAMPLAPEARKVAPVDAKNDRAGRRQKFEAYGRTHDPALREALIFEHLGMVHHLASRFVKRSERLEDLVQVGIIGLIKAVDRFDPSRGIDFSSFAVPTIVGEIKRHFRDKGWAMHVNRRIKDLHVSVGRAVETLTVELGRAVTPVDVAKHLNVSVEDVLEAQEASNGYILQSLDAPRPNDPDAGPIGGTASDPTAQADLDLLLERASLKQACAALDERERTIVYLRFFQGVTQSEIARRLDCTQMHVSRLQARALEKMRRTVAQGETA